MSENRCADTKKLTQPTTFYATFPNRGPEDLENLTMFLEYVANLTDDKFVFTFATQIHDVVVVLPAGTAPSDIGLYLIEKFNFSSDDVMVKKMYDGE